jgi:hypothetical protein
MPHFPKPFFKKSRNQWYVEIDRRLDFPRNRGRGGMGVSCVIRSPAHV